MRASRTGDHLKTLAALLSLALLVWLTASYRPRPVPIGRDPDGPAVWALLAPLVAVAIGLLRGAKWGTTLGLAIALAVLPWATVLTLAPNFGAPIIRQLIALIGSGMLLVALLLPSSSAEGAHRDGASSQGDVGRRWIRWCMVLNLVSAFNLYLFLIAYDFGASWQLLTLAGVLLLLLIGSGFLARNVTGGLLVLAVSAILMVPGAALFVLAEAESVAEAGLFAILFGPGVIAALGTVAFFSRPLARLFRESP